MPIVGEDGIATCRDIDIVHPLGFARRFDTGFDVSLSRDPEATDMIAPRGSFLLAMSDGLPIGCVGLKGQGGPLAEIKRLSVNERIKLRTGQAVFPKRFPPGKSTFKVATLAEEIELIQGLNASTGRTAGIYTEIKRPAFHRAEGQDISRIVIETLARYGYKTKDDALYLQCFDWNETQRIRSELGYRGRLVQLIADNSWNEAPDMDFDTLRTRDGLARIAEVADGVGPWMPHVVSGRDGAGKPVVTDLVATAHELGLEVHAFTFRADALPDGIESLEQAFEIFLVQAGIDGLFTDFPDRGVAFVNGLKDRPKP